MRKIFLLSSIAQTTVVNQHLNVLCIDSCIDALLITILVVEDTIGTHVVDDIVDVKGEEAIKMAKFLRNTGDFDVGYSSGAALLGAINYLKDNGIKGKNVVIIFPDKGNRYSW